MPIPMVDTSIQNLNSSEVSDPSAILSQFTPQELAQALLEKLAITDANWHRLKSNRNARAGEQAAAALVFLLKDQPEEALPRFQQAVGWLDKSLTAPPCQSHGNKGKE